MREVGMGSMWIKGSMSLSLEDDTTIVNDEQSKIHSTYVPLGVVSRPLLLLSHRRLT